MEVWICEICENSLERCQVCKNSRSRQRGTSKNASRMVKGDRIGSARHVGEEMNSALQGISPPGDGDLPSKEGVRDTLPHRLRSAHPPKTL